MCRFSKIAKSAKSLHPTAVVLRTPLPKHVSAIPDILYTVQYCTVGQHEDKLCRFFRDSLCV